MPDDGLTGLTANTDRSLAMVSPLTRHRLPEYKNSGVSGYLIKPVRQHSLKAQLLPQKNQPVTERKPVTTDDQENTVSLQTGEQTGKAEVTATRKTTTEIPQVSDTLQILLAEDNRINAVLATALIKRAGHEVDVALNGIEAIEKLQAKNYHMVLMDMHMPEMDGLEASRKIRALDNPYCDTPIIALTANAMASDRKKCLDAGMDDFISKPFDPEDLITMLHQWAKGRTQLEAAS